MRILAVDDEFITINKLKLLLSDYGTCDAAETGQQSLDMFLAAHEESRPYDLIALDIQLPDMTGQDVLGKIRKWELENNAYSNDQEAKILMVTAMHDRDNILSSFRKGCEGYLTKPFDENKLKKSLTNLGIRQGGK